MTGWVGSWASPAHRTKALQSLPLIAVLFAANPALASGRWFLVLFPVLAEGEARQWPRDRAIGKHVLSGGCPSQAPERGFCSGGDVLTFRRWEPCPPRDRSQDIAQ